MAVVVANVFFKLLSLFKTGKCSGIGQEALLGLDREIQDVLMGVCGMLGHFYKPVG